jgi:hypothetical protein
MLIAVPFGTVMLAPDSITSLLANPVVLTVGDGVTLAGITTVWAAVGSPALQLPEVPQKPSPSAPVQVFKVLSVMEISRMSEVHVAPSSTENSR